MTSEAPQRDTFRWDRLTAAAALVYCMLICAFSVSVVLGELRAEFDINGVVSALHGSTFGVGLLVSGVLGVRLVGRLGRRRVLELSVVLVLTGVALFVVGRSWPVTLSGTVLSGFGAALVVVVMPGLVSDHHGTHRAAAFAAVNGVPGILGITFGLVIGAVIDAGGSWRVTYVIITLTITMVLVATAAPVRVPDVDRSSVHEVFSVRGLLDRSTFTAWWPIVNGTVCEYTVAVWGVPFLHEVGGASSGTAAMYSVVFGVMMTVARLNLGRIVRLLGDRALGISFVVAGLGATMMCIGPGLWPRVAGLGLVGFGGGPLYPLSVDRFYGRTEHRLDSVALSAYSALGSGVAIIVGPLTIGALSDLAGLRWAILAIPALALLGVVTLRAGAETAG
mgnify:FL=1